MSCPNHRQDDGDGRRTPGPRSISQKNGKASSERASARPRDRRAAVRSRSETCDQNGMATRPISEASMTPPSIGLARDSRATSRRSPARTPCRCRRATFWAKRMPIPITTSRGCSRNTSSSGVRDSRRVSLSAANDGRLQDAQPDEEADPDEHDRDQERHAPAPGQERARRRSRADEQREHGGRKQQPAGHAHLGPGAVEPAARRRRSARPPSAPRRPTRRRRRSPGRSASTTSRIGAQMPIRS